MCSSVVHCRLLYLLLHPLPLRPGQKTDCSLGCEEADGRAEVWRHFFASILFSPKKSVQKNLLHSLFRPKPTSCPRMIFQKKLHIFQISPRIELSSEREKPSCSPLSYANITPPSPHRPSFFSSSTSASSTPSTPPSQPQTPTTTVFPIKWSVYRYFFRNCFQKEKKNPILSKTALLLRQSKTFPTDSSGNKRLGNGSGILTDLSLQGRRRRLHLLPVLREHDAFPCLESSSSEGGRRRRRRRRGQIRERTGGRTCFTRLFGIGGTMETAIMSPYRVKRKRKSNSCR